ncbi:alpha-amylase family protein [Gordonia sp. LSe1-13]|uniref:Alpha-amylase family protein n=1 Tax=Gordonia sesuvii TaxID=3116777 RepID=A0ABU7M997_9ACTN|nr:alpha-amylase family protein [Gordonia sp. LSe1-13]
MTHLPYTRTYRRALLDMHIPDWDPLFMTKFDPVEVADAYADANLGGAMIYCKSHVGLNNWPAPVGPMHPGLKGRDVIGELVTELHDRDISVCAYQSVTWDNWAWHNHPEWRTESSSPPFAFFGRVGTLCMNNPGYRDYEIAQVSALAAGYAFDAFFIDIAIWDGTCSCTHCVRRYEEEEGRQLPEVQGWTDPDWVHFQRTRERWSAEFCDLLHDAVEKVSPGLPFYSNATLTFTPAYAGRDFDSLRNETFVGGDRYGNREDQMLATKVFSAIVPGTSPEFITGRVLMIGEHVEVKSESAMTQRALAAMVLNSALLYTDCVNPDGSINRDLYKQMGRAYSRLEPYEQFLGGMHVEQVGVYFSERAMGDPTLPSVPLSELRAENQAHLTSWLGAARALQRAHIPFGAVTRFQLDDLDRFDVIVLPNLHVMSDAEAAAFRGYVERGGRLYASGHTGIVNHEGVASADFSIADVLGVHWDGNESGRTVYLRPLDSSLESAILPQDYISHMVENVPADGMGYARPGCVIPRLAGANEATALAKLTLPYGYPDSGSLEGGGWSSIHNDPPWDDTSMPAVTENRFGEGTAIYSVAPLEFKAGKNADAFVHLVRRLLTKPLAVAADAHPTVWVEAYEQPEDHRMMIAVLNYQEDGPPIPTPVTFSVPESDREIKAVRRAVTGEEIAVDRNDGTVSFAAGPVEYADMFLVEYSAE